LTVTYTRITPAAAGTSEWRYDVTIPDADLQTPLTAPLATGSLVFDNLGNLTAPDVTTGAISVPVTGLADSAADMPLTWNLYDSNGKATITQLVQASANLASSQDGTQAGQLIGISIGPNGQVSASYSNGDNLPVAQLAVASFLNPGSMQDLGNNTFG